MVQMEGSLARANNEEFKLQVQRVAPVMEKYLDSLKTDFKTEIDSNRRLESINTLEELIAALVKRNFIDVNDRKTWTKLNPKFQKYELIVFHEEPSQDCLNYKRNNGFLVPPQNHLRACQQRLTDDVIDYLSTRMQTSWRDFAKELGLKRKNIDDIERKYDNDHPLCVREILQIYEQHQPWMSKSNGNPLEDIMKALELLKRDYMKVGLMKITGFKQLNPR